MWDGKVDLSLDSQNKHQGSILHDWGFFLLLNFLFRNLIRMIIIPIAEIDLIKEYNWRIILKNRIKELY